MDFLIRDRSNDDVYSHYRNELSQSNKMYIGCFLMIIVGFMIRSSQCCIGCRFPEPLVFAGRMVFDTPTGTLNRQPMENEEHIIIIQQPRFRMNALSSPFPFRGSGIGKVWKVPESAPATFCKAEPMPDANCILPPGPPTNVHVDVNRRTQSGIQIVWEPPTVTNGNIIKYEIRYRAIKKPYDSSFNGEDFQEISVLAHTLQKLEYFLGNLDPSTVYKVQVSAFTFIKQGACVSITARTEVIRVLEPVDIDDIPPPERTEGEWVVICLPPLKQEYATGYLIQVVKVKRRHKDVEVKYLAAFINKTEATTKFTVGDRKEYGDYINRPLLKDQAYEVYIGVASTVEEDTYVEWSDPIFIEAFEKPAFPVRAVIISVFIIMACIFAAIAIMLVRRRTRDKEGNIKRNKRGNRRNLALPEIPQDVERYKVFTSSTTSRGSESHVPIFDPYGVDFAKNNETGVSGISTGIDIARIQNRRLPEKPPPVTTDPRVILGTYVKPQTHHVLDKLHGTVAETEGTTRQMYGLENVNTEGECHRSSKGKGYLKDFEKHHGMDYRKRNGMAMSKFEQFPLKQKNCIPDFEDEYDDTDTDTITESMKDKKLDKRNGTAMSKFGRFSRKQEKSIPDFEDEYDDTDIDTISERRKDKKQDKRNGMAMSKFGRLSRKQEKSIPDFEDEYDDTATDTITENRKDKKQDKRNGMAMSKFGRLSRKQEKSIPDFEDEYDDTATDTITESKKGKRTGMAMSRIASFARNKKTTLPDFGDTYDDTDVDTVTGSKKYNSIPPRENECRYSITRFGEDRTSVIYEDAIDAPEYNAVANNTMLADVYEETELSSGDDVYEDTMEATVDGKKILPRTKESSKKNSEEQNQDDKKEQKNKTPKKWFQWKKKDAPVTDCLGKENIKVKPTAEVGPVERKRVNYSGHLYPLSSVKTEQTGRFLGGATGKQVDVDQFNDIYEDTIQMEKKENTSDPTSTTHPRPPRNPPQVNTTEIRKKWKGFHGANNTQQNVTIQPNEGRKLGDIKDYGDEYDETAVVSKSDRRVTMTTTKAPASVLLPPRPVQIVIPSGGVVWQKSKDSCHVKTGDEELYEDTSGAELYEDTRSLDHGEEFYEVI